MAILSWVSYLIILIFSLVIHSQLVIKVMDTKSASTVQKPCKNTSNVSESIDIDKFSGTTITTQQSWISDVGLSTCDKDILCSYADWLNDQIIDGAQKLIKQAPSCGFQSTVLSQNLQSQVNLFRYYIMDEVIGLQCQQLEQLAHTSMCMIAF